MGCGYGDSFGQRLQRVSADRGLAEPLLYKRQSLPHSGLWSRDGRQNPRLSQSLNRLAGWLEVLVKPSVGGADLWRRQNRRKVGRR